MVGAGRRKARLPRKILRVILSDGSCQLQPQVNDLKPEVDSVESKEYYQKDDHYSNRNGYSHTNGREDSHQSSPSHHQNKHLCASSNIQHNDYERNLPKPYHGSENFYDNFDNFENPSHYLKKDSPRSFQGYKHSNHQDMGEGENQKPLPNKQDISSRASYKHQHPEPTPEFPYQCETCDMLFKTMEVLMDHQTTVHENNRQFACRYCSKRFNDKYNMRKHVLIHVGEKRHKCQFCDKAFLRKDHLRSHLQTHYNRKYGCKFCGKGFRTPELYERHLKTHKDEVKSNPELLQPDIIDVGTDMLPKKAVNGDSPRSITSSPTIKEDEVAVTILDDDYNVNTAWNESSPSVSENDMSMTGSPLRDDVMQQTDSSVHERKNHQHELDTVHKCKFCKKEFNAERDQKHHEHTCTSALDAQNSKYQCSKCNIIFDESLTLKQHYEKVHSISKPVQSPSRWRCKSCNINYPNSKELSRHYAQAHKDAQLFPCSECPKTFTVWHNLKKHMLIHLGDKKHKCTVCDKGFVRKDHLNSHMKVHLGEGSKFTCHVCSKVFRLKQMYFKHMNLHGLEQAYTMVDKY